MKHLIKFFILLYATTLIVACGGSAGSTENNTNIDTNNTQSLNEKRIDIYNNILADNRFSEGFYTEEKNDSGLFKTIKHISNYDAALNDVNFSYPICKTTFEEAFEISNSNKSAPYSLNDSKETQYYYEFSKSISESSLSVERVFKCKEYEVSQENNFKGEYKNENSNIDEYLKFIEYLWYFSYSNNYGNIVLSSTAQTDHDGTRIVKITNASLLSAGECDEITIKENYFELDESSKEIERYEIITDIYKASKKNGNVDICS